MRPCDLCGETASLDTPGDPSRKIRICSGCGFVHVKERRSVTEIAQAWTDIYRSGGYNPEWPGVKARLFYVAEWLDQTIGLRGKSVLDIGAGNGQFLAYCRDRGANPFGLDPDLENRQKIDWRSITAFAGYASDDGPQIGTFDLVALNWTLENTGDVLEVLRYAKRRLKPDGHVVVATGSRILVPFKKPLSSYLPQDVNYPHDTHCFRWSVASLAKSALKSGLKIEKRNDFYERDEMVWTFSHCQPIDDIFPHDHAREIEDHFLRWQTCFP